MTSSCVSRRRSLIYTLLLGLASAAVFAATSAAAPATSQRNKAASTLLWYLGKNPLIKREFARPNVRLSVPAPGVLSVARKDRRAHARVLCGPPAKSREMRTYSCSWNVIFLRRATYRGFAFVKFYKLQGGFDVETGRSTCRPIEKSKTCKLYPPPR